MNTEDFNKYMTVFFSKSTGMIKAVCQGDQPFEYFNEDAEDMEIILDKIIVEYNPKILFNRSFYKVVNKQVVFNKDKLNQFTI